MPKLDDVRGVLVPIPTPFDGEGEVDEPLLEAMVRHYVDRGANALVAFGSYGQGPAMSISQRRRSLEVILNAAAGELPVIPDVGTVDPYRARDLAVHAEHCGVVAMGMVAPYYYNDRRTDELVQHFQFVANAVDLPVLLMNSPSYQGYPIQPETVGTLREAVPSIFGVHPAHVSLAEIARYQREVGTDFRVFASPDTLLPGMFIGQTGIMSPPLSLSVESGVALISAIEHGEVTEALRLQLAVLQFLSRLDTLRQWFRGTQLEGLRYIGFPIKQFPRVPVTPLPEERAREVHEAIDELRAATGHPPD